MTITEIEIGGSGWGQGHVGSMGKGKSKVWLRVGTGCNSISPLDRGLPDFSETIVFACSYIIVTVKVGRLSVDYIHLVWDTHNRDYSNNCRIVELPPEAI